jgi:hypothetical protein
MNPKQAWGIKSKFIKGCQAVVILINEEKISGQETNSTTQ